MRNRPGALNGPHPVVIVPHKENGGCISTDCPRTNSRPVQSFFPLDPPGGVWYSRQSIRSAFPPGRWEAKIHRQNEGKKRESMGDVQEGLDLFRDRRGGVFVGDEL